MDGADLSRTRAHGPDDSVGIHSHDAAGRGVEPCFARKIAQGSRCIATLQKKLLPCLSTREGKLPFVVSARHDLQLRRDEVVSLGGG
jgi:hypothetical protein